MYNVSERFLEMTKAIVILLDSLLLRVCMSIGNYVWQMLCTKNSKQILPEIKLHGVVPNFYIHVSVSDFRIPTISPQT
jgi:hypothetical protein